MSLILINSVEADPSCGNGSRLRSARRSYDKTRCHVCDAKGPGVVCESNLSTSRLRQCSRDVELFG